MLRTLWLASLSALALLKIPTGAEIIQSMHDRYAGKWFKTLTFVQTTTRKTKAGTDTVMTWYESAALPGHLRIDVGRPSEGNGALYTHDSTYQMAKGVLKNARSGGNELVPMIFDVYVVAVDLTLADMRHWLKIDLSKVTQSTWDGRPVYVIGADLGNERVPQVWVDTERLVVLREIFAADDTTFIDSHLENYRQIGQSWIAPECEFFVNGKFLQREQYAEIRADVPLSPALFDPAQWTTAPHWAH